MKASEAKQIAASKKTDNINGVYQQIKQAAEVGKIEIDIPEVSAVVEKQLETDGYKVESRRPMYKEERRTFINWKY